MTPTTIRMQIVEAQQTRASLPELLGTNKQQEGCRTQMRRCSWNRQEPCRVNATWDNRSSSRKRDHKEMDSSLTSMAVRRSSLIDEEELESLTAKLWTNEFAGTIDPRFHWAYVQGSDQAPPQVA